MKKIAKSQATSSSSISRLGCQISYDVEISKKVIAVGTCSQASDAVSSSSRFSRKNNRYEMLRMEHRDYRQICLGELLQEMFLRRKRYSLQMIKLLYMFPDDTFSENYSVNSYDRLFYNDEHIHTIVKIYETKEMQTKIWAFLNLKGLHTKRKLQKFSNKIENVQRRLIIKQKRFVFDVINQFSIKIRPMKIVLAELKQTEQQKIIRRSPPKQANNITVSTKDSNQIIRITTLQSSPLIRRIPLLPDQGVKISYPTSVPVVNRSQVNTSDTNRRSIFESNKRSQIRISSEPKIIESSRYRIDSQDMEKKTVVQPRTIIQDDRRVEYHRPSSLTFIHEPVRRYESVEQHPYYTKPIEVREVREYGRHGYGHDYLIHTVQGNCTINIHTHCSHDHEHRFQRNRSPSNYILQPSPQKEPNRTQVRKPMHSSAFISQHESNLSHSRYSVQNCQNNCCGNTCPTCGSNYVTNSYQHRQPASAYNLDDRLASHRRQPVSAYNLEERTVSHSREPVSAQNLDDRYQQREVGGSYNLEDRIQYLNQLEQVGGSYGGVSRYAKHQ